MTRWMRLVAAVMLATAGASCGAELAVVPVTKPKDPTKPTEEGVFYALPRTVAKVVVKALESRHPRSRYVVTPAARALIATRTLGGDRVWDFMIRQQFKA